MKRLSFRRLTEPVRKGPSQQHYTERKRNGDSSSKCPFCPHPPSPHSPTLVSGQSVHIKILGSQYSQSSSNIRATSRAPTLPPSRGGQGCYFSSLACSLFRRSIFFCSFLFTCSCFFSCSVCWTFSRNLLFFFLILASSAFLFSSRSGSCNSKCQDT